MKKLLAIVLVLGLASMANAAILQSIKIAVEAPGVYGIVAPDGLAGTATTGSGYWAFVGTAGKPIVGGTIVIGAPLDMSAVSGDVAGYVGLDNGVYGEFTSSAVGTTQNPTGAWSVAAGTKLASGFTSVAGVVSLYTINDDWSEATLVDTYQVPEPITMTLMGLGGLVALRRRMA